ncbi:MAG: peptidoglycan-binding protein, partial [Candidatus Omnitrophica bacterium]|nr:peptidoglycan-binding protein [Candidatus Omnitrophota bacterium]
MRYVSIFPKHALNTIVRYGLACGACVCIFTAAIEARAMGRRPDAKKSRTDSSSACPEIEIISRRPQPSNARPDAATSEIITPAAVPVTPQEILPAVGVDSSVVARSIRTVDIQVALKNAGFDPGAADGKLGPKTKKALRDFQKQNGLVSDGIVGPRTWEKLKGYLPKPQPQTVSP